MFLLSPANCRGRRAQQVLSPKATFSVTFSVAARLRGEGVPIGELFAHMSGLYFRGKITSEKYVQVLSAIFGSRLVFPATFVGRGDMSRGGLRLRAAAASQELEYIPVIGAVRHGTRPPKLSR